MKRVKMYDLEPQKDSRQSFYSKARVEEYENGARTLYSYNTEVCTLTPKNDIVLNDNVSERLLFSQTTLRHIKEFLYQELGLENLTKAQLKEWCY